MRALISADWQLQNYTEFSSLIGEGYNRRLVEFLAGITAILEEERPDLLIVAGDLWNNKSVTENDLGDYVHRTFLSWKENLVDEIILLLGNHDVALLSAKIHSLSQFQSYCTVITEARVYRDLAFSPWRPTLPEIEADLISLSGSGAETLIGHWTVKGAASGSVLMPTGVDPEFPALRKFKRVLLGDIHLSQKLGKNILYLGSPSQINFGEENNVNFVWLLDTKKDFLRAIPTSFPRFKTVSTIEEAERYRGEGYFVRIKAGSREEMAKGNAEGFRVEQDFTESVASEARGIVNNVTEAVVAYAVTNNREDLAEPGLKFLEGALATRTVPAVEVALERLHAENFLSYADLDLDFREPGTGLIVIHGEVVADQAYDSNGAGKTALYEAIYYGLFGTTLRYGIRKDATIRNGEKKNCVSLDLTVRRPTGVFDRLLIDRPRPGVVHLSLNGTDLTSNDALLTQKKILELVGESAFFLRISFLGLHYHPSFLRLSDPEKKKFIDQFSGLDCFTSARELVNDELKRLERETRRLEVEENRYDERRTLLEASLSDAENSLTVFRERERKLTEERENEVRELKAELARLAAPVVLPYPALKAIALPEPVKPDTEDPEPLRNRIAENEAVLEEVRPALAELRESHHAQLQPLFRKEEGILNEIATLKNSTQREVCPMCNRKFDDAEKYNRHVAKKIGELTGVAALANAEVRDLRNRLDAELASFKEEISAVEKTVKSDRITLAEIEALYARFDRETNAYLNASKRAGIEHKEACNEIDRRNGAARRAYDLQVQRINDHLLSYEKIRPAEPTDILAHIETLKAGFSDVTDKISDLRGRTENLIRGKADLEFWVTGFGNSGCKSLLYTNLIDSINRELADICNVISGGALALRLLPYSETARGDVVEKISLEAVNYLGADVFDGDSLGEQNRIDIAVAFALRRVLQTFSGYSSNVLFIDEPFTGLDRSGKTAVYALLKTEAERALVLVTDQEKATKGETDCRVWTVTKANRISVLAAPDRDR
jgi:DNA repair exonuclease SbcCD ATPase subunit/DNA repair exonuclease SbcCD nuclease subunit